jgi:hypothetical protein
VQVLAGTGEMAGGVTPQVENLRPLLKTCGHFGKPAARLRYSLNSSSTDCVR